MKLNDITCGIYTTNEEQTVLEQLEGSSFLINFNEREQVVIENLIRKSLVSKINYNGYTLIAKNDI